MKYTFSVGFANSGGAAGMIDITFCDYMFTVDKIRSFIDFLRTNLLENYRATKSIRNIENVLNMLNNQFQYKSKLDSNLNGLIITELDMDFNKWFSDGKDVDLIISLYSKEKNHPSVCLSSEGSDQQLIDLFKLCGMMEME